MKIQGTKIRGLKLYSSAATVEPDSYFDLVTLLLPGNGTNGSQNNTFLDSSTNNLTITRNGNPTQGTFSPFSQTGWSVFVNSAGSSTSTMKGLTTPNSTLFDMVNGGTVECWVYLTQYPAAGAPYFNSAFLFSFYGAALSAGSKYYGMSIVNTGALSIIRDYGGSNTDNTSSTIIPLNTWTHIAWSRISGSNYFFVNGTDITSTFTNPTLSGAWPAPTTDYQLYIGLGAYLFNIYTYIGDFNGYISNFRVVKGSAVYSASFTPPTQPLTAVSGTSLLTCQSNRYIDNSTNALAITPLNTPSVQPFSPFNPDAAYSTTSVGGSGYFDGTGDFLTYSPSTSNQFGTGSFTVEAWYYPFSAPTGVAAAYIYDARTASVTSTWILGCRLNGTGAAANLLGWYNGSATLEGSALTLNAWNHVVYVRNSITNTGSLFLNGTRTATQTDTTNYSSTGATATIGSRYTNTDLLYGYLQDLRVVKGTAVYDASATSITVPTAPLTAITNTSLLLNYTNGGITDAAAKNVLETVGGAAISTAQSKFGGSSMYFDGTGDYLTIPNNVLFALGTGDFTIECWVYSIAGSNNGVWQLASSAFPGSAGLAVAANGGAWTVYYGSTSQGHGFGSIGTGTWQHVALVRQSGSLYIYSNGVKYTVAASDTTNYTYTTLVIGGYYSTSFLWNGYINDLRITRGYARYTANFTPPTSAFPTQ